MSVRTLPLRRIVLATDLRDQAPTLFAHSLALALHARAHLFLVHIVDTPGPGPTWQDLPTVRELLERWGAVRSGATAEDYAQLGLRVHPLDFAPTDDDVPLAVTRRVLELKPDLVVLGTEARQGVDRVIDPSVAEPVARELHRVTLIVPTGAPGFVDPDTGRITVARVLVPITIEVDPQALLDQLTRMLTAWDVGPCAFTFVHVGSDDTLPTPSLPERGDWTWRTDRRRGSVVEQILEAEVEHRPDLIAMATEGPHGLLDALRGGSTTERVLRRARAPLFVVPAGDTR